MSAIFAKLILKARRLIHVLNAPASLEGEITQLSAIDLDWSALRFRRAEHIKTLSRHQAGALTARGKQRTSAAGAAEPEARPVHASDPG